jgi:CysZ protein
VIISAFAKAIAQLPEPSFRKVFLKSFVVTLAAFILVGALAGAAVEYLWSTYDLWFSGWISGAAGTMTFVIALWLFSPAVATVVITTFFMGEILEAVEKEHYPHDVPGQDLPIGQEIYVALRFLAVMIVLNLVMLVPYLVLALVFGIGFLAYFALNGYLMGREYFEAVAHRYSDIASAKELRRRARGRIFFAGATVAFLFTIPVVNFFAPIIAPVAMIHIFKGLRAA